MSGMSEMDVTPTPARPGQPDLALRTEVRFSEYSVHGSGGYATVVQVKCDPRYMDDPQGVVSTTRFKDVAVYHIADLLRILEKHLDRLSGLHIPLHTKDIPCIVFRSLMTFSPIWGAQNAGWQEHKPIPQDPAAYLQLTDTITSEFLHRWGPEVEADAASSDATAEDCSPRRRPRVSSVWPTVILLTIIRALRFVTGRRSTLLLRYPGYIISKTPAREDVVRH